MIYDYFWNKYYFCNKYDCKLILFCVNCFQIGSITAKPGLDQIQMKYITNVCTVNLTRIKKRFWWCGFFIIWTRYWFPYPVALSSLKLSLSLSISFSLPLPVFFPLSQCLLLTSIINQFFLNILVVII